MELVEHITSLFDIQVDTVVIKNDSGTRFMNWVQQRQRSLRMVDVNSYGLMEWQFDSEDLKNIIMECEADHIQLNALHSSPFEIRNLNKKFNVFECLKGTWITVDNLMTLDCVSITVKERRFTCAELNTFLNHWFQGGSPRLRTLIVAVGEYNRQEVSNGLDAHLTTEKILIMSYCGTKYQITGFWEVERNDGMTIGFAFDRPTGLFWVGVWPSGIGDFIDLC
uniref:FBA_2 domain-containing protein n=1 Tax=Caenorhabditis tropicalis TaxID=1561998 RepID=A0A1I7UN07_9PELO